MSYDLTGVKVGDTLIVLGGLWGQKRNEPAEYVVMNVARKLLTARPVDGTELSASKFRRENGQWNDPNWGYQVTAMTPGQHTDLKYRGSLLDRLATHGLRFQHSTAAKCVTTPRLERVVEILESAEDPIQGE